MEWAPEEARPSTIVARDDVLAVDGLRLLDDADRETGQVVFAHGGRCPAFLTSRRRSARQPAACNPLAMPPTTAAAVSTTAAAAATEGNSDFSGAEHQNVVDAHRHQILAHRVA